MKTVYEKFTKTFNELDSEKQKEVLDFAQLLLEKRERKNNMELEKNKKDSKEK